MFSRIAARPKCSSSARATRYFKCRSSISSPRMAQNHERLWLLPVSSYLLLYIAHLSQMYWRRLHAENYNIHEAYRGSQDLRGFHNLRCLVAVAEELHFEPCRNLYGHSSTSTPSSNPATRRGKLSSFRYECAHWKFGELHDPETAVFYSDPCSFKSSIPWLWSRTRGNCRRRTKSRYGHSARAVETRR